MHVTGTVASCSLPLAQLEHQARRDKQADRQSVSQRKRGTRLTCFRCPDMSESILRSHEHILATGRQGSADQVTEVHGSRVLLHHGLPAATVAEREREQTQSEDGAEQTQNKREKEGMKNRTREKRMRLLQATNCDRKWRKGLERQRQREQRRE